MASKKYTLLAVVLVFFQLASNAQTKTDWGWDWKDSSKIPTKSIPQYNEFLNNQFPYPPKPRNAWELGLSIGNGIVIGDRPLFTKNAFGSNYNGGVVGALSLRKALGHVVSLRGSIYYSVISIPGISNFGRSIPSVRVHTASASIDAIFSLNALSYYRGNPKSDFYVLGGYTMLATQYKSRQSNGDYTLSYFNKSQTAGQIQDLTLIHAVDFGGGMSFKVSPKFNIGIEQKFVSPMLGNDYIDGYKVAFSRGDMFSYSTIRFNFNLGN